MPPSSPGQRVRAQARRAVAFGLLALLPAALDADHEPDGERDGEALDELECVHGGGPASLQDWLEASLRILTTFACRSAASLLGECDTGSMACGAGGS